MLIIKNIAQKSRETQYICFQTLFYIQTVSKSLAMLGLQTPITKKEIKNRYLTIAKQHHPDSSQKSESKKIFIEVTQAYKFLNQLSEQQINKKKRIQDDPEKETTQHNSRKMSEQQKMRAQTYQYFRGRYKPQTKQSQTQEIYKMYKRKKAPLYKTVPQIFIGLFFVALLFGEWAYHSFKRQQKLKKMADQNPISYQNVFSSMNFRKRFGEENSKMHH